MQMTVQEVRVQRVSIVTSASFDTVCARIDAAIGHPDMMGDPATLIRQAKPGGPPLTFDIPASGSSTSVRLKPYYEIAHERYATYWKLGQEQDLPSAT